MKLFTEVDFGQKIRLPESDSQELKQCFRSKGLLGAEHETTPQEYRTGFHQDQYKIYIQRPNKDVLWIYGRVPGSQAGVLKMKAVRLRM